jgi:hypothetical protein
MSARTSQADPGMTPGIVLEELTNRFHRAPNQHEAATPPVAIMDVDDLIAWIDRHGQR